MAGFDLRAGEYRQGKVSDDELWSALCGTFSSRARHDTSYKYAFMKAILDNLYNIDDAYALTFDQLFSKFAEIYWNLILKYNIKQKSGSKTSYIEQILKDAKLKYQLTEDVPFEALQTAAKADICLKVKQKCKNNVVGALYGDTQQLFYSFNIAEQRVALNPAMYHFLCKHKLLIEKVNYFEWATFLEKVNDETVTTNLLTKLDESAKRNNLAPYRQILYNEFEQHKCFYCGKDLDPLRAHVDHFVPWSFIKDDKLWNFVLACPTCNISKNDKLATEPYLYDLRQRNDSLARRGVNLEMETYNTERLPNVYAWAQANGYDTLWQPKKGRLYPLVEEYANNKVAER